MTEHGLALRVAWQRHVADDVGLLERLIARHRERHRRYHDVTHVEWVVRYVDVLARECGAPADPDAGLCGDVDDLDAVAAAAFYHDAVHEPRAPARANERASARLARRDLASLGWAEERCERVGAMIEATADHRDPADLDAAILFDADLSVLGADAAGYGDYVRNVRAEYRHVSDEDWATGRAEVLAAFLRRPDIFATAPGRHRWETLARANITAELAELAET